MKTAHITVIGFIMVNWMKTYRNQPFFRLTVQLCRRL